jgi:hypothetical protein
MHGKTFGNIALHATDLKIRPRSKSLSLIQRYRRVRETLEKFSGIEKAAREAGIETRHDNLPANPTPFCSS